MITYLKGTIAELEPTSVIIDCNGVGYLAHISLTTYTALRGQTEAKVLVSPIIREDAHTLYGFATESERELFALLISVSGIGPNTARVILSQYSPSELNTILTLGQVDALKAVKGIGLKTAQRIVLELKGKVQLDEEATAITPRLAAEGVLSGQVYDEAMGALRMLGYVEATATKAVRAILTAEPTASVEAVIRQALKQL